MISFVTVGSGVVSKCRKMLVGILERANARDVGASSDTVWEEEGKDTM